MTAVAALTLTPDGAIFAAPAGPVRLECVAGDIARQPGIDAVVNAANAALMPGAGVAGALHHAAGPGLYAECRALAPILPGQAVLTAGYELPNRFVIHCLGPVYGADHPEAQLLASCYQQALALAARHGARSIAFPAISTGVFGYPPAAAAEVALGAILAALPLAPLALVRCVLFAPAGRDLYLRALAALAARPVASPKP